MKRILLSFFMLVLAVGQINAQCSIGYEGPYLSNPTSCYPSYQSEAIGGGAYTWMYTTANTYYWFDVVGSSPNTDESQVCVNGTLYTGSPTILITGTLTRVGTDRNSSTWSTTSATLRYAERTPTVVISQGTTLNLCGTTTTLSASTTYDYNGASWSKVSGTGSINASTGAITGMSVNSSGVFRATAVNGSCSATDDITVYNRTPTTPTVSGGGTYCSSTTITASGSAAPGGFTYYFQGTNSNGTSTSNPGATETITSSGTYYFRARSTTGGCWSASTGVAVTINTPVTITSQPSGATICEGGIFTPDISATGTGLTYQWQYFSGGTWSNVTNGQPATGFTYSNSTNPTTFAASTTNSTPAATYQFRCVINPTGACPTVNSNTANLVVVNDPVVTVSGYQDVCTGGSVTLAITSVTGGQGSITGYQWYDAGGAISGATGSSYSPPTSRAVGSYTYRVNVYQSGNGCVGTNGFSNADVVADPTAPTITKSPNTATACIGDALTITSSGGSGGIGCSNSYRYSTNNGASWSSWSTSLPSFSAVQGTNIVESRRSCSGSGCGTAVGNTVSWNVLPNAAVSSVSGTSPICIGATTTFTASGVVLGGGTGAWSSSNPLVASVNASGVVTGVSAGTANIIYTVSGGCNGTQSAQQSITVLPVPVVGLVAGTSPLCIGQSATYLATGVVLGGGSGSWSSSNTGVATVNASGVVTGVSAGTANIIYTTTGLCGTDSKQQAVTITPDAAVGSVSGTSPLCLGSSTTYTASGVVLGGGSGAWSSSNTGVATVNASGVVTPVGGGTTNIIYTVTGGCNGTASAQQALTVNAASTNATLVTGTTVSAVATCVESPWTYYANPATPDEYIFAIRKNGNTFVAAVEIVDQAGTATYSSTGGAGPDRGTFLIGRHWNVTLSSGSVVSPVDVRFFVDPAEVTQAQAEATAFLGSTPFASNMVGLTFFKTVGSAYSPGMMAGGNFTFTPEYLAHSTGTLNGITYYELTGITSFSGGTGGFSVNDDGSTLPVELLSWEANSINNEYVELTWSTATEINNAGFEIQRSVDGVNFETQAWVDGNGNSTVIRNYVYEDREVTKGERYYYQLKQVDNDGESETFNVVSAELQGKDRGLIGNLVPNPSKENGFVRVDVTSNVEEALNITIYNHVGARVADYKESVSTGSNTLQINIDDLSSGTYFINFEGSFGSEVRKLVLIK